MKIVTIVQASEKEKYEELLENYEIKLLFDMSINYNAKLVGLFINLEQQYYRETDKEIYRDDNLLISEIDSEMYKVRIHPKYVADGCKLFDEFEKVKEFFENHKREIVMSDLNLL